MRTLVIGDIHGGYKALLQILDRAEVTPEDQLIFLGDYVDGWSEAAQSIDKLIELSKIIKCIFIRGNHDVWCGQWLNKGTMNPIWLEHGGRETIESYIKTGLLTDPKHKQFFNQLQDYHINEENKLFLHAGFSSMHGVTGEEYASNFYWDRTLWEAALLADKIPKEVLREQSPQRFSHYKEIFIGHTPTTNYNQLEPMKAYNVFNVDTGAAFKGKLTIMDIETKEFWQSDRLYKLYANEKGRN
ncbi:serine/threonine protein phosphatase 1 [Nonlabens dokdonensis]|jgi:serine/threonine protein phosphatase 1|uniref:Serine/threonine protein phosphatase n=2 Tax=Nonlabens dokdonensis TaxID=328515 RepID=L7W6M2_NONDD|nr:metallophosphoesterase [Nonlabens dokdonensis]AGC75779.1 serine/threonine protein phosphatase [Nonlabens dokdonensis DSW-6]PZX43461.1 serine/threonine protein phosphatase 1 [Nonlabens dokdonensis]